jgi:hypothetical protein
VCGASRTGETGDRGTWILFQLQKFMQLPWLVPDRPLSADGEYEELPRLQLADGADPAQVTWSDIGYADAYLESYQVFARLRADGVIPAGVRFQVEYPAFAPGGAQAFDAIIAALARCVDQVPSEVPVGLHLCYGTTATSTSCSPYRSSRTTRPNRRRGQPASRSG